MKIPTPNLRHFIFGLVFAYSSFGWAQPSGVNAQEDESSAQSKIEVEIIREKKWISPIPKRFQDPTNEFLVKVWFDQQFLADGDAYKRRAKEFSTSKRTLLRTRVVTALKKAAEESYEKAKSDLERLVENHHIRDVKRHWIVNGFSCITNSTSIRELLTVPGVTKVFVTNQAASRRIPRGFKIAPQPPRPNNDFVFAPSQYKHPWYCRALMAEKTWKKFGITGQGTLNIVHDFNFQYPANLTRNLSNSVGFNFLTNSRALTNPRASQAKRDLHGTMCAAIICGHGTEDCEFELGIAPEAKWAGIIAGGNIESSVEWAIEQSADTYSMSFSQPGLRDYRSHWRKVMEHGSFCGVYFVSGAGNFAQTELVPLQMRTPEDIPEAVFAAAGVRRDLSRTEFSSKGPVDWSVEHYGGGLVQKPEVCAFNQGLPMLTSKGEVLPVALNGNSFAGPMFCGAIALMVSADPDLLPWDLKQIITSTATDIGPKGVDSETGHGLINCFRAVKEVLRRKAIRQGTDSAPFFGREKDDSIDPVKYKQSLTEKVVMLGNFQPNSIAAKLGFQPFDVIVSINGTKIKSVTSVRESLKPSSPTNNKITVSRNMKPVELEIGAEISGFGKLTEQFLAPVFK